MKKVISVGIIFLLVMVSVVSARTLINGKIYNSEYTNIIEGANVEVTCNGNLKTTTSADDGSYAVDYDEIDRGDGSCNNGDDLNVYAYKGGLSGSNSGIIHDDYIMDWDLAIVNVPLVPEFGVFVGALTILSAIGVFFFIRRD